MPVNLISSEWSSGSLIFKRKVSGTGASVTLGEDTAGLDFKVFGDTTGKSCLWDSSANKLIITGTADLGDSVNAVSYSVGGTVGISWTSGTAPTSMQIINGIVTYSH